MAKRILTFYLGAALLLLAGCGGPADVSGAFAVFTDGPDRLARPFLREGDAALWEESGLSRAEVVRRSVRERTVGDERWLLADVTVGGIPAPVYFREAGDGSWQLDLSASTGRNALPLAEWRKSDDLLTVRVTAERAATLPEAYRGRGDGRFALRVRDSSGTGSILAAASRATSDGEALADLLADGLPHRVLLRLRGFDAFGTTAWRVVEFLSEGWFDEAEVLRNQCGGLLRAVRNGDLDGTVRLLTPRNLRVTDRNNDGLLFLALRNSASAVADHLIRAGCSGVNDNAYWHGMGTLLDFERTDILALTDRLRKEGRDPGCTDPGIAHYLVRRGNAPGLESYCAAFPPDDTLPPQEREEVAARYGLPSGDGANLLDLAVTGGDHQTAETLLRHGARASDLLREKIRRDPLSLGDGMLSVLGRRGCFGVMDGVLDDYAAFRESFRTAALPAFERFSGHYSRYRDAEAAGDFAQTRAIMDSYLLDDMTRQLEAVRNVTKPDSEAVGALWDRMFDYADMMDTAGYYYRRTARSTYKVTRRYSVANFEDRMEKGERLRIRFLDDFQAFERLYRTLEGSG